MARALTETDKKPGNSNGKFALKTFGMRAGLGADVGGGGTEGLGDAGMRGCREGGWQSAERLVWCTAKEAGFFQTL